MPSMRSVAAGTTAAQVLGEDDRSVVAARVGGELKDLAYVVEAGDVVEAVAVDSPDGRAILRHSTAHVMAQAVQSLHEDAKLGIGPPIEDGFYYDFGVDTPFNPDDLAGFTWHRVECFPRIESRVRDGLGIASSPTLPGGRQAITGSSLVADGPTDTAHDADGLEGPAVCASQATS